MFTIKGKANTVRSRYIITVIVFTAIVLVVVMSMIYFLVPYSGTMISERPTNTPSEAVQDNEVVSNPIVTDFLNTFQERFPDFEIINYFEGTNEKADIQVVAIARNIHDNSESHLFVVDKNGTGVIDLAAGLFLSFYSDNGLYLSGDTISLSLIDIDTQEIYDYCVIYTENSPSDIVYTVKSKIRENKGTVNAE